MKQEEKGTKEDEIVRWHHRLNGHEFEQAPAVGDGQGNLGMLQWGHKESDMTECLNRTVGIHSHGIRDDVVPPASLMT